MLIAWTNRADAATVSAGSQLDSLPGSNVQHPHVSRKWHTAAGTTSSYLLFDMGSAVAGSVLAVLGTNLTPSATVRLRASTSDATAVTGDLLDTGSVSAGVKAGYGAIYKSFSEVTARYWRLDLDDSAVAEGNLQVGRVFIGPSWSPTINEQLGGSNAVKDRSVRAESWGGQAWIDQRPRQRVKTFTLEMLEAEMFTNAFAIAYDNGTVEDVLVIPDITSTYLSEQAVFGLLDELQPMVNELLGLYQTRLTVEERL